LRARLETELAPKLQLVVSDDVPPVQHLAGYVDAVFVRRRLLTIYGWGMLQENGSKVFVNISRPVKMSEVTRGQRPDVVSALGDPRLALAGFILKLYLDQNEALVENIKFRIWTDDSVFGLHLLHVPSKHSWPEAPGHGSRDASSESEISHR
jgi:hypothetical protein